MTAQALGYLGVRAKDLGDWGSYGTTLLGLQRIDRSRNSLAFRMDDRKQRIIVDADGGEGIAFFGWEVAGAAALDAVAARLEGARVPVARGSRALAEERLVTDLIVTTARVTQDYGVPVVHGIAFVSGINVEATEAKILSILTGS